MATAPKPELTFNGKPVSTAEATKLLTDIYGEQRVSEILAGLANGTYQCASVAGGYLQVAKQAE